MFHKLMVFILLALFWLFPVKSILAAGEFKTSYDVKYDVGLEGETQVVEKITLTNLTETYYASNFVLTVGSTSLSDVTASDEGGEMEVKSEVKDNKTNVTVKFNEQITGINKTQVFTMKYKSNDFASRVGKTWEVDLPRIHEGADIENFNVILSVPLSFGEPTSITPKPKSESDGIGRLNFNFTKEQLSDSGVTVNFGNNQIVDFKVNYTLNNSSFFPEVLSVPLPPETNYQDILISSINPLPLNVTIDEDGNYLAWYQVQKRSSEQVLLTGTARLYITPKANVSILSKTQINGLLKADKYWEKDNPSMKAVLAEIFKNGKPNTTTGKAHLIYQYVINTLRFNPDNSLRTRLGALTALSNLDKARASEFTDLFITLCRAEGIPARALDGTAFSQNKWLRPLSLTPDVTHVWPEFYDDSLGWTMVDPTWEQTSGGVDYFDKFDLNHLVLDVRGVSSQFPVPTDNASIAISSSDFQPSALPQLDIDIKPEVWAGLPGTVKITIQNNGNTTIMPSNLAISAKDLNILNDTVSVGKIPPFGFATFYINFRAPFLNQNTPDSVIVTYLGKSYTKQISITPFFLFKLFPYLLSFSIFLVFIIYFFVLGLHVRKTRKGS